jgi:hypothetical protein
MGSKRFRTSMACALSAGLVAAGGALAAPMVAIKGDPVATASGQVAGTQLASGVKAYLGVPYAKPPTQDLRWKPPQPVRWDGVWNADRKGAECIQVLRPHDINHYFGEEATSEDCLYLNVWTPADAKPGDKLPVVVFIYGGGGTIGSSGMANYDGENFAKRGAIFVNLNYRVGVLGFLAHPELTQEQGGHSGNYGYLDQNAALKWIQANIGQFGATRTRWPSPVSRSAPVRCRPRSSARCPRACSARRCCPAPATSQATPRAPCDRRAGRAGPAKTPGGGRPGRAAQRAGRQDPGPAVGKPSGRQRPGRARLRGDRRLFLHRQQGRHPGPAFGQRRADHRQLQRRRSGR